MGLSLAGGKKTVKGRKAVKPVTKKPINDRDSLDSDDEIIMSSKDLTEDVVTDNEPKQCSCKVDPFTGGLVHPSFESAVNSFWKRSAETSVFMTALSADFYINGTFFGAIYTKPSFVRKTGGNVLL